MSILLSIAQSYQERTPPATGSPILGASLGGSRADGASLLLSAAEQESGDLSIRRSQDAYSGLLSTLRAVQLEDNRRQTLRAAWVQLEKIRTDQIQPAPGWEQTAAFLILTGQPFKLNFTDKGEIAVEAQIESELREYTPQQRVILREALGTLQDLTERQDERERKAQLRADLFFAAGTIDRLKNHYPPSKPWEFDFVNLRSLSRPVQVSVNDAGEIVAVDQTTYPHNQFEHVENLVARQKLREAVLEYQEVLADPNQASKPWHYQLVGGRDSLDDVYLDLNDDGEVVLRSNNILTIIPDDIRDIPEVETSAPWQEEALRYTAEPFVQPGTDRVVHRTPFYLDFDPTGRNLRVVKNDLVNVTRLNDVSIGQSGIEDALVNLLA